MLTEMCSSGTDLLTNEGVAIKKVHLPFNSKIEARRIFREVRLLRHLAHDNVCILSTWKLNLGILG